MTKQDSQPARKTHHQAKRREYLRSASVLTARVVAPIGASLIMPAAVLPTAYAQGVGKIAGGKPISLVVSYPVGGGADLMARLIAPKLAEFLGQAVVVENKPGASGTIAAAQVARATPDGTMLLLDASSFSVNPALMPKLAYDNAGSFSAIGVLALFPNVLVCNPNFDAKSVADVIKLAKAKPRQIAYASSGNGSAQHLAGALFEKLAKVELNHVPYRGGGPALNDVIGGQVPLFFANVASSLGHIKSGRLRPLAVTSKFRSRALPDIASMQELGVAGHEVLEWNPVLVPKAVPNDTKALLVAALKKAMDDPEVLGRVRSLGGEIFPQGDAARAEAFLRDQEQLWGKLVRERGISLG